MNHLSPTHNVDLFYILFFVFYIDYTKVNKRIVDFIFIIERQYFHSGPIYIVLELDHGGGGI